MIYFFCYPHGPPERAGYEHLLVALAEGLTELGVEICGSRNHWPTDLTMTNYLIPFRPEVDYRDCRAVVFTTVPYYYRRSDLLPQELFSPKRRYRLVLLDGSFGFRTRGYDLPADLVLKAHYNRRYQHPSNFRPWQFGLTRRLIESARPRAERSEEVLVNFRVRHTVRRLAAKTLLPALGRRWLVNDRVDPFVPPTANARALQLWKLTGRRHYPEYFERLGQSRACSAFGGYLQTPLTSGPGWIRAGLNRLLIDTCLHRYCDRIYQFDSWRFWESLVSGCITLQADFERYGMVLPVMPRNGVHYLGYDLSSGNCPPEQTNVGESGRLWALEHYSPAAVARRFLDLL